MPPDSKSPGCSTGRFGYFAGGPWVIATSLPETAERALTLPQPQPSPALTFFFFANGWRIP